MDLCEENYHYLLRLAPELRVLQGCHLSRVDNAIDLYLEIQEQTPYTTLIHLTYYFDHVEGQRPDPDIYLRVYHDSAQAEVLDLRQSVLQLDWDPHNPLLDQKWKANLFLSKWLAYCVGQGHVFSRCSSQNLQKPAIAKAC